jgi:hypothetical protein
VKGHRVANGEMIDKSETLDPAANDLHALVPEQQLASHEFEPATGNGDEVTVQ